MKCGYDRCENVRDEKAASSVMDQGIMRNGIWYCSHSHYEEQIKIDWHKKSKVDNKRKCHNLGCFNMRPAHFWEKLKSGEGLVKDGYWYCSPECYDQEIKRQWIDERERYISRDEGERIHKVKFGALLMQQGVITLEQLENALEVSKKTKKRIGETLLDLGYISENVQTGAISKQAGIRKIDLSKKTIQANVINLINKTQAKKYKALPVEVLKATNTLIIAISDPSDKLSLIDLRYITNYSIEPFIVPESALYSALKRYYKLSDADLGIKGKAKVKSAPAKDDAVNKRDLDNLKSAVNAVLSGAKEKGAGNFDMRVDGQSIKGSFDYGDIECTVSFKKKRRG